MEIINAHFKEVQDYLSTTNKPTTFSWSETVVSEIMPNVARSLSNKFKACENGYSAAKIAALYTFWIARLKPGFGLEKAPLYVNEYLALKVGFSIVHERLNIDITLTRDEMLLICDILRYHTSSPHMLLNLYNVWIEREKLKTCLRKNNIDPKSCYNNAAPLPPEARE